MAVLDIILFKMELIWIFGYLHDIDNLPIFFTLYRASVTLEAALGSNLCISAGRDKNMSNNTNSHFRTCNVVQKS
jgi:hypothetical protein